MTGPYYQDDRVTLYHGDCLDVLAVMPDASVDSVCTDPPYGLEFMGKEWDSFKPSNARIRTRVDGRTNPSEGKSTTVTPESYAAGLPFQQWCEAWAREALRVLKPGGHMLAFGGTRTWHRLAVAIEDAGFEIRDSIAWLYGSGFPKSLDVSKAIDKAAGAEREVIRERTYELRNDGGYSGGLNTTRPRSESSEITAPSTDAARQWQGWGTALKPAWEGVICASKPVPLLDRIGSRLDVLEDGCRPVANDVAQSSAPIPHDSLGATTGSVPARAATQPEDAQERLTPTGAADGSCATTDTSSSESVDVTCSNIVTSWKRCWEELCEPTSTSTTATTPDTTIDLTTLWSCLSKLTEPSMLADPTSPDGLSSLAHTVDSLFAAAVLTWRATRALIATESATSATPQTYPPAAGSHLEPIIVARKPLTGTVAANVLAYGVGALNIDACRIEGAPRTTHADGNRQGTAPQPMSWNETTGHTAPGAEGRWPANVTLDESQAAALDQQSGTLTGAMPRGRRTTRAYRQRYMRDPGTAEQARGYGDSGGASRFFPTFRYEPKAPGHERPLTTTAPATPPSNPSTSCAGSCGSSPHPAASSSTRSSAPAQPLRRA